MGQPTGQRVEKPRALRDAIEPHPFIALHGARLCGQCGLSGINPVHRRNPEEFWDEHLPRRSATTW